MSLHESMEWKKKRNWSFTLLLIKVWLLSIDPIYIYKEMWLEQEGLEFVKSRANNEMNLLLLLFYMWSMRSVIIWSSRWGWVVRFKQAHRGGNRWYINFCMDFVFAFWKATHILSLYLELTKRHGHELKIKHAIFDHQFSHGLLFKFNHCNET